MVFLVSLVVGVTAGPSPASATPVTWRLDNAALSGGRTATGSFTYDADTNTYSNIDITVEGGAETRVFEHAIFPSGSNASILIAGQQPFGEDQTGGRLLRIRFSPALDDTGGTVDIVSSGTASFIGICNDPTCTLNIGVRAVFTAGQVTTGQRWYIQGARLRSEDRAAVGSFLYDANTDTYSGIDVTLTGFGDPSSNRLTESIRPEIANANNVLMGQRPEGTDQTGGRVSRISFVSPLTNAGGTIDIDTLDLRDSFYGICNDFSCAIGIGVIGVYSQGRVTTNPLQAPALTTASGVVEVPEGATGVADIEATDDFDSEGSGLTYTLGGPDADLFVIDGDTGQLSFDTPPDFEAPFGGGDSDYDVTVTVTDQDALSDSVDITVRVTNVNEAPVIDAIADQSVDEGQLLTIPVVATDPDGDGLTITVDGLPTFCTSIDNGDGTAVIDCAPGFADAGVYPFTVEVADDGAPPLTVTSSAVDLTVNDANAPPVAVDDSATTDEDTSVTIDVVANDTDFDDDPLAVVTGSLTTPGNGTAVLDAGGTVTYTPEPDFNGSDTFEYTVSDGDGGTATATVTITIAPVEDAPVAVDDAYTTDEDTPLSIPAPGVLGNDSDADGDPLTAVLASGTANGSLTLQADGTLDYTPDPDFAGTDSFTYLIINPAGESNIATVTITVNPVDDTPVAADDTYSTDEDVPLTVTAPGVLGNDADADGDGLTAVLVSGPSDGTLMLNADGSFVYTPAVDFNGTDSFAYVANDGTADSNGATVVIAVEAVHDDPVAVDDSDTTDEDTPVTVDVVANDTDAEGDALAVVAGSLSSPGNGMAVLDAAGTVTYTPDADFNGTDSFQYTVADGNGGTAIATVEVTVVSVNDVPVAADDTYSTDEDVALTVAAPGVLANDSDVDGDPLTAVLESGPSDGNVTLDGDGSFTYTPSADFNGTDSFTYRINDGGLDSGIATVTIAVAAVNDGPVARDDVYSTDENVALTVSGPGLLANDSDVEGDLLTAVLVDDAANGTVSLNTDGSFSYLPDADFVGDDSFTYAANDGAADSNVATVTVTVNETSPLLDYCLFGLDKESKVGKESTVDCSVGSNDKVKIEKDSVVGGDVVGVSDDVTIEERTNVAGDVKSGDEVTIKKNAMIGGDVVAAGEVEVETGAAVGGGITQDSGTPPVDLVLGVSVDVTPGSQNITVDQSTSLVLAPGDYRDLRVKKNATLILSAGTYNFRTFKVDKDATIELDLNGREVIIGVLRGVSFKDRVQMTSDGHADQILFQVENGKVELGKEGRYLGTFLTPSGDVKMAKDTTLTGALYGRKIESKEGATIVGQPAHRIFIRLHGDGGA